MVASLITRRTADPLEEVCSRLGPVCQRHGFGVLGTHDLRDKMNSKGVPFIRECRVYEVCDPRQAARILEQSMEVAAALPCRISVYVEDGETVLSTLKPSVLLPLISASGDLAVAAAVEKSLTEIMEDVCRAAT